MKVGRNAKNTPSPLPGKEAAKQYLQDNPDVAEELETKIREAAVAAMKKLPDADPPIEDINEPGEFDD